MDPSTIVWILVAVAVLAFLPDLLGGILQGIGIVVGILITIAIIAWYKLGDFASVADFFGLS